MSETRSHTDLKACPFCGGAARIVAVKDEHGDGIAAECTWGPCGVSTPLRYSIKEDATRLVTLTWNARRREGGALAALVGLVDLLLSRDDLPERVRETLTRNWRISEARELLTDDERSQS